MKFVEFLARWVIALQERLGPGSSMVPRESESSGRSASPRRECSHSASPTRESPPPSRHGSPIRTDSGKKASKDIFSPHSQSSLKLWATMNLSNQDVDDTFTGEEGQDNRQTPLPHPGKRPRNGSDDEASPSKRTKLDVSNLYGAAHDIPSKGDVGKGDGTSNDPEKSKAKKTKKTKKKSKESEEKIGKKEKAKEKDKKETIGEKKKSEDRTPKTKAPEQKTPEKTRRDPSGGENSDVVTTPKSRRKPIRMAKECQQDKWASDSPLAISYRQCRGIFIHTLPEGRNFDDHTDYIRQLMRHKTLGVNIKRLDDRIQELQGLTSSHHVGLLVALK